MSKGLNYLSIISKIIENFGSSTWQQKQSLDLQLKTIFSLCNLKCNVLLSYLRMNFCYSAKFLQLHFFYSEEENDESFFDRYQMKVSHTIHSRLHIKKNSAINNVWIFIAMKLKCNKVFGILLNCNEIVAYYIIAMKLWGKCIIYYYSICTCIRVEIEGGGL